jgi:hypothetical protein
MSVNAARMSACATIGEQMYSWGQLRLLLIAGAPGISPDLLDGYLNLRYGRILDFYPWTGLEAETTLQTAAAYTAGTVTVSLGSDAIVGVGTAWTNALTGFGFQIGNGGAWYTATITGLTTAMLGRDYEGDSGTALGYSLFQNVYTLPADLKVILSITGSPWGEENLLEWSGAQMEQSEDGMALGDAVYYALGEDTPETSPPVLHTVELYPAPLLARGYSLRYTKAAFGFTGENTADSILPWVSDECLLNGCRADIQAHLASQVNAENPAAHLQSARGYEALFGLGLAAMVRQDNLRRPQRAMGMDRHYTRHRIRRVRR